MSKNLCGQEFTLSQTSPVFLCVYSTSLLKTLWGKAEIAGNERFLLFPQCFSIHLENFLPLSSNSKLLPTNSFSLKNLKIYCLENMPHQENYQSDLYLITTNLDFKTLKSKTHKNPLENIHLHPHFNSLPNNKILDSFKLKTFADDVCKCKCK